MVLILVCMSLRYLAKASAVATLANSLGCSVNDPMAYQLVAPLIFFPNGNKRISDRMAIT